ncbi:hypothetical protein PVAP13_2KG273844 [Panicum virgatum]|uniref:Uncharacterized protein n=1 Tax=Panicum virgatum TaxID=38727 RepID=A0A8T0W709_PANVG|nr:hypothetical protein PVAP13_2KG273844 [Panicum virgatum]
MLSKDGNRPHSVPAICRSSASYNIIHSSNSLRCVFLDFSLIREVQIWSTQAKLRKTLIDFLNMVIVEGVNNSHFILSCVNTSTL